MPINTPQIIDTARQILEVSATIAFALSGVLKAAHKKLDVVGVCVMAFIAAFGLRHPHPGPFASSMSRSG